EHQSADGRTHAVAANKQPGSGNVSGVQSDAEHVPLAREGDHPRAHPQAYAGGNRRLAQTVDQIRAMDVEVARAIAFARRLADGDRENRCAALAAPKLQSFRLRRNRFDGCRHVQPLERLHGVGAELETGADLSQRGGLLDHLDFKPGPRERKPRCETANPGSCNDNLHSETLYGRSRSESLSLATQTTSSARLL